MMGTISESCDGGTRDWNLLTAAGGGGGGAGRSGTDLGLTTCNGSFS